MRGPLSPCTWIVIVLALSAVSGGAGGKTEQATPGQGTEGGAATAAIRVWKEAPALAARNAAGELPSARERLPKEPFEVTAGSIGRYGGSLDLSQSRESLWTLWNTMIGSREMGQDAEALPIPLLIRSLDVSPDGRVFTFHLRDGLRWSDGDPCDADDYLFAWDEVIRNAELTPRKPAELVAGGRLARFEKIDQYTVSYTFAAPHALFPRRLAQARSTLILVRPSHYLKQFHPSHTDAEALAQVAREAGYESWTGLFATRAAPWSNAELPVLDAWVRERVDDLEGDPDTVVLRRNPYFWQVDKEGNQLPYVDTLVVAIATARDDATARVLRGEVDLGILLRSPSEAEALTSLEQGGGHELRLVEPMHANIHTVFLNRTVGDPELARLFGDVRFRRALSLAVDRGYISDEVHGGAAVPSQVAPPALSAAYDPAVALADTERDVEAANTELDAAGLAWDKDHVWRLLSGGAPLALTLIYPTDWPPEQAAAAGALADDWSDLGIQVVPLGVERQAWMDAVAVGDWQLTLYAVNAGGLRYLPVSSGGVFPLDRYWLPAPAWGLWLESEGAEGAEPPAAVKRLHTLYEEYVSTASRERSVQIETEAFALYARELMGIGVVARPSDEVVAVVSSALVNVPEGSLPDDLTLLLPASLWLDR